MTFIPLLGYYLLRPEPKPSRRTRGAARRTASPAPTTALVGLGHRSSLARRSACARPAGVVGPFASRAPQASSSSRRTSRTSRTSTCGCRRTRPCRRRTPPRARRRRDPRVADEFGREHPDEDGKPREVLESVTTFVGGGGPRFWFSVAPELFQPNYAQLIIKVNDKHDTDQLVAAAAARALGAMCRARASTSGSSRTASRSASRSSIRISGENIRELRRLAEEVKASSAPCPRPSASATTGAPTASG